MNRHDWLLWRQKGIGSSDAAAVLGISPYMNKLELYESKVGPLKEEKGNFITDQGNRWEPEIRKLVEAYNFETFEPATVIDKDHPYLRASLDGQSKDGKTLLEIKIIGKEPYEAAKRGEVPAHYLAQIYHQLGVTGADKCIFACHLYEKGMTSVSMDKLVMVDVPYDKEKIFEQMKKVIDFWSSHVIPKIPPEVEPDYKPLVKTKTLEEAFTSWKSLTLQAADLELKISNARDVMLNAAKESGHKKVQFEGVRIREEFRKANVDYKKIPAVKNMTEEEFEKYRGPGAYTWKIELIKDKKK